MREHRYHVYIMASDSGTLYVGVTSDLVGRVWKHKNGTYDGFTARYRCHKLVYFEDYQYINEAIAREKQIKSWRRSKKETLIRSMNPGWRDLSLNWEEFQPESDPSLPLR